MISNMVIPDNIVELFPHSAIVIGADFNLLFVKRIQSFRHA